MPRKEPFKTIMISLRIYEAVNRRRFEENKDEFRPLKMNPFCEKILWDYAQGKFSRAESAEGGYQSHTVGARGEPVEARSEPEQESPPALAGRKHAHKRTHRSGSV